MYATQTAGKLKPAKNIGLGLNKIRTHDCKALPTEQSSQMGAD